MRRTALLCAGVAVLASLPSCTAATATASSKKPASTPKTSSSKPCGKVSVSIQDQYSSDVILVPAADALACLESVPLTSVSEAKALIEELKLYLSWQSNIGYYSNPPDGYAAQQADVTGRLNEIVAGLDGGNYTSEYELQYDVSLALAFAYDFHLGYSPDILGQLLFYRGEPGELALVSLSKDGQEVPKLYNYYEWRATGKPGSAVVEINGQDAVKYLESWSRFSAFHDADARYNRQFVNQAQNSLGAAVAEFTQSMYFDSRNPATTTIKHANGTTFKYANYAIPMTDSVADKFDDGIDDGAAFFDTFCDLPKGFPYAFEQQLSLSKSGLFGKRDANEDEQDEEDERNFMRRLREGPRESPREQLMRKIWEKQRPAKITAAGADDDDDDDDDDIISKMTRTSKGLITRLTGYPKPNNITNDGIVSGYYLSNISNSSDVANVAVLALPSFYPETSLAAVEFQDVIQAFLQQARADNKTRLVVDLRGNTGGRIFLGYDLFKQLFPSKTPYGATRFRANDAFNEVGKANSKVLQNYTYDDAVEDYTSNEYGGRVWLAWSSMWNYRLNLDDNEKPFDSWEDFFGPDTVNGDKFTSLQRYNFADQFADDLDIDVSGYGVRADSLGPQPFAAEDIVLLQDGSCGSTCAIFAEMAKMQGKVRQVVIGGAPATGPMQSVAGSKGAQVIPFSYVYLQAYQAYYSPGASKSKSQLDSTELGALVKATRPLRRSVWSVVDGSTASSINLRDNLRAGDSSQTPLEFVYEAADCRLFYTAEMLADVGEVWTAAALTRWGSEKGEGCVKDSTGDPSSLDGGYEVTKASEGSDGDGGGGGGGGGDGDGGDDDSAAARGVGNVVAAVAMALVALVV